MQYLLFYRKGNSGYLKAGESEDPGIMAVLFLKLN